MKICKRKGFSSLELKMQYFVAAGLEDNFHEVADDSLFSCTLSPLCASCFGYCFKGKQRFLCFPLLGRKSVAS
jgi:hypothetical protein